tara:strand:+ start:1232 stop:1780 length:549 start_codon:yes stop_codon:yes gene_type:complete
MDQTKRLSIIPLLALGTIHILFLWMIVVPAIGWFSILGLLPLLAYKSLPLKANHLSIPEIGLDILSFTIGILFTMWIIMKFETSSVFASALIGTLVSFIPNTVLGIKPKLIQNISHAKLALYAGSFTGMTGFHHFPNLLSLFIVGITGGVLYNILRNSFTGLGGKLGSIGFGAIILYITLTI